MSDTEKLTKPLSKLYIEHACNHAGTNKVAELLGITASRVSEMKSGRRNMTWHEGEMIKAEFGLPDMSTGVYVKGELLKNDWYEQFMKNAKLLHLIDATEDVCYQQVVNSLLKSIYVDENTIQGYLSFKPFFSDEKKIELDENNCRLIYQEKQLLLDTLLNHHDFEQWHKQMQEELKYDSFLDTFQPNQLMQYIGVNSGKTLNDICSKIRSGFGFNLYLTNQILYVLYYYAQLYNTINSDTYKCLIDNSSAITVGESIHLKKELLPTREYVLSGRSVWSSDRISLEPSIASPSAVGWLPEIEEHRRTQLPITLPKIYKSASFDILYTEHNRYFVKVELSEYEFGSDCRSLLIEIENRHELFEEVSRILETFNVHKTIAITDIKHSLATNGAYIPNAIYIN